ncbi:MAG: glycoside hydrolase [Planctomycetaceae bacterium]|nr:glycoside hydrolase [Planctomycetaceae bacterium]
MIFCSFIVLADETKIVPDKTDQWSFTDKNGSVKNGELVFDGTQAISKGFYLPLEWNDTKLSAKFKVESGPDNKVLACGFIVKAFNAQHYYYVHFDRRSAILVRFDESNSWLEIKRVAVPNRQAETWYDAALEIKGDTLKVFFDGKELYEVQDSNIKGAGRIGFYGSDGIAHVKDIIVSGQAERAVSEFKNPKPLWVHVCTDAGAGGYEAFPDVCRLKDGRLLCVFYAGYGHVSVPNESLPKGGRIVSCYSSDEGQTWTKAETIIDTPLDDRDPSVVQLPDGRILLSFFTYVPQQGEQRPHTKTCLSESNDNGKTWSEPKILFKDVPVSQPIRILSDGTLLLPLYLESNQQKCGAVSLSYDNAKTWSEAIVIPNGGPPLDAETDVIELKDGTLYAIQRPWMGVSYSKDKGKTWSVSEHAGFEGHCPYLLRTKNDVILLATRIPQTSLRLSRDECKTWSAPILVDHFGGAYPSMVELKDGSILIVYYEEGTGSSIRAKRFNVTKTGVEWLPMQP